MNKLHLFNLIEINERRRKCKIPPKIFYTKDVAQPELSVAAPPSLPVSRLCSPDLHSVSEQVLCETKAKERRRSGPRVSFFSSFFPSSLLHFWIYIGLRVHVLHGKVGHFRVPPKVKQSVHPAVLIIPDSNPWEAVQLLTDLIHPSHPGSK